MRNLTLFMTTTIDGFIAQADGGLWDAFPWPPQMQDYANDFYRSVDTAIYGRHTYTAIVPWWRNVAEGQHPDDIEITDREIDLAEMLQGIKKYVFSRTLDAPIPDTVLAGDPAAEVAQIKSQSGGRIALHGGAALVVPLLTAGLVDDLLIFVTPAALGAGRSLFAGLNAEIRLTLADTKVFNGSVVLHHYRPTGGTTRKPG